MSTDKKNLILHITSDNPAEFREKLRQHEPFKTFYDGWESTIRDTDKVVMSTRYYYYDIPHNILGTMLRHIQSVREGVHVQVKITRNGNFKFD